MEFYGRTNKPSNSKKIIRCLENFDSRWKIRKEQREIEKRLPKNKKY